MRSKHEPGSYQVDFLVGYHVHVSWSANGTWQIAFPGEEGAGKRAVIRKFVGDHEADT